MKNIYILLFYTMCFVNANAATKTSIGTGDYSLIYFEDDEQSIVESVLVTATAPVTGSIWDSGLSTWLDSGVPSIWDAS